MRRARLFATLAALALCACAGDTGSASHTAASEGSPAPPSSSPTAVAVAPAAPQISLPPAPISVPAPPTPDQCGAYLLSSLIGRPRTEIPVPVDPTRRRVVCTTCPRTQDFRPDRLTIEYDAASGKVTKAGCG